MKLYEYQWACKECERSERFQSSSESESIVIAENIHNGPTRPWCNGDPIVKFIGSIPHDCKFGDSSPESSDQGQLPMIQSSEHDPVNSPDHYRSHPTGTECIDIIEWFPANIANAIKYLWRAGLKGGKTEHIQDLRKAAWYANREADRLQKIADEEVK